MNQSLLGKMNQKRLSERLKRREGAAWNQLVSQEHRRLFNLHLRLSGDREAAADLTQDTFTAAYESADTFSGQSSPQTWLYGVALNTNRNWWRRTGRHDPPEELDENLPDPQPTAEELVALREQSDLIYDAVRRLPESYRRAVALRYFAGVSAAEMAESEGVDAGTMRWRLHQALKRLWVMLQPRIGKEIGNEPGAPGQVRLAP